MTEPVEYGPFTDGYVAAMDRTRIGRQAIAEDSTDCGIDPTTGAVYLRPGSALSFDVASPVGLLESKWGAVAQDLLAFLSSSFTDAMENLMGLWSDETDKEAQVWFRSSNNAGTNQTIGKSYGTTHRSSAVNTIWNLQMIPLMTDHATQTFTRCATELARRVIASGSRNLLRVGSALIAPCRTGTPFYWNGRFNDTTGAGSEKEYIRPLGPMPPLFPIRKSSAPASSAGTWLGSDTAIWAYAYVFENGEIGQPYLANAGDAITINAAGAANPYPYVTLIVPPGPRDCIRRVILRTKKWNNTTGTPNSPIALFVCGYIDNNFQTVYLDSQGDDSALISRPDLIRFDLIMPPRARKYGTMDGRIVAVDLQANPSAIFLAPYSSLSATPNLDTYAYDDLGSYGGEYHFFKYDGTNIVLKHSLSPGFADVVEATIPVAGQTLQNIVDTINAVAPAVGNWTWRAQLAPGMDRNALASDLQATSAADFFDDDAKDVGGGTGNCRVIIGQTLPGLLYMANTSSWMTRSVDKRGVHFTMSNPATTGTETDAPLAPNAWKGGYDCRRRVEGGMGRVAGVGSLLDGCLILSTRGTAVLRNVRGGKTGADTDYRLERWLIGDGLLGPDAYAEGDGWVVYARRNGIMVNDGKREVCISYRVFNPKGDSGRGRGPWKYEWSQGKKWQAKDDQSSHLHVMVAHGRIYVTYRSSAAVSTPDRMMFYDFTQGVNALGVDQVLRDDGTPFAWSAPCKLNGSVMGAVTRDDGDHLYMVRSDFTATVTGDGRVDEFEITTSTSDNGTPVVMAAHLQTDRFDTLRMKKRLVRATVEYYDATGGGTLVGYGDFARSISATLSALPAVTDGTIGKTEIVRCPTALRAPLKTLELKVQNPSGSARFELHRISAEIKRLNTVGP